MICPVLPLLTCYWHVPVSLCDVPLFCHHLQAPTSSHWLLACSWECATSLGDVSLFCYHLHATNLTWPLNLKLYPFFMWTNFVTFTVFVVSLLLFRWYACKFVCISFMSASNSLPIWSNIAPLQGGVTKILLFEYKEFSRSNTKFKTLLSRKRKRKNIHKKYVIDWYIMELMRYKWNSYGIKTKHTICRQYCRRCEAVVF